MTKKARSRAWRRIAASVLAILVSLTVSPVLVRAETDWSSVLELAAPAVVLILVEGQDGGSLGSGAIISSDGHVLTAHHVIEDAETVSVYVPEVGMHEASVVNSSADADIAVLKIATTGLPSLPIGNSSDLRLEEEIRLLGYPQQEAGVGLIIGIGVYLGTRVPLDAEGVELIQIDVSPFDHGHSGGPVINAAGEVVGVAVRTWTGLESGAEAHKLAVSINTAKLFIPSYGESSGAPSIRVQPTEPTPSTWEIFGFSNKHLYIIPGDPAVGFPIPMPRSLPVEWAGDLIVGPDGQFYCTDVVDGEIVRFDPRTREPTLIFESGSLSPADLAFDVNGNLLFSTYARDGENSGDSMGIWRILEAIPGAEAERIIKGSRIRECGVLKMGCRFGAPHVCALLAGPYRGDLLVSGNGNVPIARAIGPDYEILVPFIQDPGFLFPVGEDPIPDVLSDFHQVRATGNVLATDFIRGRILEFDSEGGFIRIFSDLYRANRLTSDYAGNIYASGSVWGGRDLQHIAGFSPNGESLFELPIGDVMGAVILER